MLFHFVLLKEWWRRRRCFKVVTSSGSDTVVFRCFCFVIFTDSIKWNWNFLNKNPNREKVFSNVDEMIEGSDLVRPEIPTDALPGRSSLFYISKRKPQSIKIRRSGSHGNRPPIYRKKIFFFFPPQFLWLHSTTFSRVFILSDPFSRRKKKKKIPFFRILLTESLDPFSSYAIRIFGYGRLLFKSFLFYRISVCTQFFFIRTLDACCYNYNWMLW